MRLSRVRIRVLLKPMSTTSPQVSRSNNSILSPIRQGRSSMIIKPLMVSSSVFWAARATAREPMPRVVTIAVISTSKWERRVINPIALMSIKIIRWKKGKSCSSRLASVFSDTSSSNQEKMWVTKRQTKMNPTKKQRTQNPSAVQRSHSGGRNSNLVREVFNATTIARRYAGSRAA